MSEYKMISMYVDKKILKQIHDLMDTELIDEQGRIRFQMHKGSKQMWYRQLFESGLNNMYKKLDDEKRKLKNEDKNSSKTKSST